MPSPPCPFSTKKAEASFRNMPTEDFQALWQFRHPGDDGSETLFWLGEREYPRELRSSKNRASQHFCLILAYCHKAPPLEGSGRLSSREAVLPLVYCVKEDGL